MPVEDVIWLHPSAYSQKRNYRKWRWKPHIQEATQAAQLPQITESEVTADGASVAIDLEKSSQGINQGSKSPWTNPLCAI